MTQRYTLQLVFKSNERPWSMVYHGAPPGPQSEEEARKWADGMNKGAEDLYYITLLCDGKAIYNPQERT